MSDIDQIDDASSNAILQHYPQIVVLEVGAVVFYDMLIVTQSQDLYFFLY